MSQELMRAFLNAIFKWLFRCHHKKLSRVFTIDHKTYQVCFACGRKLQYSWRAMSLIKTSETPETLASFTTAFSQEVSNLLGSIAGDLNSEPSRASEGGAQIPRQSGTHRNFDPIFQHESNGLSAREVT